MAAMDLSFDELLEKAGVPFKAIKGSTKRAEVLETLAKRAGVEADIIAIAMWETQWDVRLEQGDPPSPPPPPKEKTKEKKEKANDAEKKGGGEGGNRNTYKAPQTSPEPPPPLKEAVADVTFTDPVKGSKLKFMPTKGSPTGLFYTVNGEARPPFAKMRLTVHTKGPRLEFPELSTAATVSWDDSQSILSKLKKLAAARQVANNIPAGGVVAKPEKRSRRSDPQPQSQPQPPPQHMDPQQPPPLQRAPSSGGPPALAPPPPPPPLPPQGTQPPPSPSLPQPHHQHLHPHQSPQYVPQPMQPTPEAPPLVQPAQTISMSVPEGEYLSVPAGCISHIVSANYTDGYHFLPILKYVAPLLQNGGMQFQVTRQLLGVPKQWPQPQTTDGMHGPRLEIHYAPMGHAPPPPLQPVSGFAPPPALETTSSQHLSAMRQVSDVGSLCGDHEDDTATERSNVSYRHNPYGQPAGSSLSAMPNTLGMDQYDDNSESSYGCLTSESRRHSEAMNGDYSRYAEPMSRPGRANVTIPRGEYLHLAPGTAVRIVRAVYGEGARWVKATAVVKAAFQDGGIKGLLVSEESLGVEDPSPGMAKTLVVVYRPVDDNPSAPMDHTLAIPDTNLDGTVRSCDLSATGGSSAFYHDNPPSPPPCNPSQQDALRSGYSG